ncbi:MAG: 50S ribosomal protein L6 [bacterium]
MSRIGKKPIDIKGVTVTKENDIVKVKGALGELATKVHQNVTVDIQSEEIIVTRKDDQKENRSLHGLTRALIQNMVTGVTTGFTKTLDIVGVGYRAEAKGNCVLFNLGYSHPILFEPPVGIKIEVPTNTQIKVFGSDKALVGLVAAKIRSLKEPEPYKGKGIKYSNEVIIRKAGKAAGK